MSSRRHTAPILAELPLLGFLPPEARLVIARSFVPVSYEFGSVIVHEGDVADALYVIESGTARVLKTGEGGEEVPLNVLREGDVFGEIGLLEHTTRVATVRASSEVDALRLDRSVFDALVRTNPELRESFERSIERRRRANFFRLHTAFSVLPPEGLETLLELVVPVRAEKGELVIRQGDESGRMYIVVEGRLRAYVEGGDDGHADSAYFRRGDFFGARSIVRGGPRGATVEALEPSQLLALGPALLRRLLAAYPELRTRVEQRVAQYDYRRVARVPLDFEELLPAEVGLQEVVLAEERGDRDEAADAEQGVERFERAAEGRRPKARRVPLIWQLDEMDCGAACVAMVCRAFGRPVSLPAIREAVGTGIDGTSLLGIVRGAGEVGLEARAVRASKSRLDELPLPAIVHWEGNHWIVLADVDGDRVRVADPARGRRRLAALRARGEMVRLRRARRAHSEAGGGAGGAVERPLAVALLPPVPAASRGSVRARAPGRRADASRTRRHRADRRHGDPRRRPGAARPRPARPRGRLRADDRRHDPPALRAESSSPCASTPRRSTTSPAGCSTCPMSYFNTRRTGDIERRLAGVRQVRQFLVQSGVRPDHGGDAAGGRDRAHVRLRLAAGARLPRDRAALRAADALLVAPPAADVRQPRGGVREVRVQPDRRDQGDRDGQGGAARSSALRRMMLTQFGGLAQRIFRADFLIMTYQGAIQAVTFLSLSLFLCVGALQVIDGALSLGEFVAFNALVLLANGPVLTHARALGRGAAEPHPARPPRRRARARARAGRRPLERCGPCESLEGRIRARRGRLPLRRRAGAGHPRGDQLRGRARTDASRSSGAAAPARRR